MPQNRVCDTIMLVTLNTTNGVAQEHSYRFEHVLITFLSLFFFLHLYISFIKKIFIYK